MYVFRAMKPANRNLRVGIGLLGMLALAVPAGYLIRQSAPLIVVSKPTIEISMFSGMPDPVCPLTNEEGAQILSAIGRLPTSYLVTRLDNLGYRGITFYPNENRTVSNFFISNGGVFNEITGTSYADVGGSIEKQLKQIAKKCLEPGAYEFMTYNERK